MKLTKADITKLNTALNEATIVDVVFDKDKGISITLSPIVADENGNVPVDNLLTIVFKPVNRFAASYRLGRWDDKAAQVVDLKPEELQANVRKFKPFAIYGQEFLDSKEGYFPQEASKLSFDYRNNNLAPGKHTFEFARDTEHYLTAKMWFDTLDIINPYGASVSVDALTAAAQRACASAETLERFGIKQLRANGPGPHRPL